MPNDYAHVRALGKPKTDMYITPAPDGPPKPADKTPLLNKENTYDKNTYTPEQMQQRNTPSGKAAYDLVRT